MKKKESKKDNISKKQTTMLFIVIALFIFLVTTGVFLSKSLKVTYSAGTITFKGANGQVLTTERYGIPNDGVCSVDANGYVDPECVYALANICTEISTGVSVNTTCPSTADQVFYKSTASLFTEPIDVNPPKGAYFCRSCTSCTGGCGVSMPSTSCYECTVSGDGNSHSAFTKTINAQRASSITGGNNCKTTDNMYCESKCWACSLGKGTEYTLQATVEAAKISTGSTSCQVASDQSICNNKPYQCYECKTDGVTTYVWSNDHCDACGRDNPNFNIGEDSKCENPTPTIKCYSCTLGAGNEYALAQSANEAATTTGGTNCKEESNMATCANPPERCYECTKSGNKVYTTATSKSKAATTTGGTNCVVANSSSCVVNSCYVCKSSSNIMKWSTNGDADTNCSAGYTKTSTPESSCVTKNCYKCKANAEVMKWSSSGDADTKCPGGYEKTDKPASECKVNVPENPKTGTAGIIIAWVIGVSTLLYSVFYAIKMSKLK